KLERISHARPLACEQQPCQAGNCRLAGDDRWIIANWIGKEPHAIYGGLVRHGEHVRNAFLQYFPGKQRNLATGQAGHYGVEIAVDGRKTARPDALKNARGTIGLDDDDAGPSFAECLPEVTGNSRGNASDSTLYEYVCRQLSGGKLVQSLLRHDGVALHHVAGYVHIALVGRIGHDVPTVG